jgi:hypothetical protein
MTNVEVLRASRHCEPTGRRKAPPDDRLHEAIQLPAKQVWIASSRSLSSGAHSRDPLAPRNDGVMYFAGYDGLWTADLPDGQISRHGDKFPVQPLSQKYSALAVGQIISTNSRHPVPTEGRFAIVTDVRRDAVDADGADDERRSRRTAKSCGPDASTPASSQWRQLRWRR